MTRSPRCAGFALPLFSIRTPANWGIGEILDLVPLAAWARRMRQRVIQLLPVNETAGGESSPYAALSAFAIDPLYVSVYAVEDVPEDFHAARGCLPRSPMPGGALPREQVRNAKLSALEAGWEVFQQRHLRTGSERARAFMRFADREHHWLDDYVLFRVFKERFAWSYWLDWPEEIRNRDVRVLEAASREMASRLGFFRYVQWVAAEQWAKARQSARDLGVLLKGDLPFVIGRDSADAWGDQRLFVAGWEVGAPPDDFSAAGQNWGLPLYEWKYLVETDLAWWRQRIRQAARIYDMFRIDHVVGLFRTYAFPPSGTVKPGFHPAARAEQVAQGEALLRMICEESGVAVPIAEDLGTIPKFVRDALRRHEVAGYAVLRWEMHGGRFIDPRGYPALSVATTGTHDTTTLAEWWRDIEARQRASLCETLEITREYDEHGRPAELKAQLRRAVLRRLYEAGSDLVVVPLQDLFGWTDRINLPMTQSSENWNYQLPFELGMDGEVPRGLEDEGAILGGFVEAAGR